jgi:hypothetical protein
MKMPDEPKAMAEIRKIRESLSQDLKKLPLDSWVSFIRKEAAAFEKKNKLNLPHKRAKTERNA